MFLNFFSVYYAYIAGLKLAVIKEYVSTCTGIFQNCCGKDSEL